MCHTKVISSDSWQIYEYKPTPSAPIVTEHSPDDTSAVGPDEEPQVYLSTECGFLVVLQNKMVKHEGKVINISTK
jgi:hypothetical protein